MSYSVKEMIRACDKADAAGMIDWRVYELRRRVGIQIMVRKKFREYRRSERRCRQKPTDDMGVQRLST